jgi:hypothetical protein
MDVERKKSILLKQNEVSGFERYNHQLCCVECENTADKQ